MSGNSIESGDDDQVKRAGMPSIGRKKRSGKIINIAVLTLLAGAGVSWAVLSPASGRPAAPSNPQIKNAEVASHLPPLAMPDQPAPLAEPAPLVATAPPATGSGAASAAGAPGPHVPTWEERKLGFETDDGSTRGMATSAAEAVEDTAATSVAAVGKAAEKGGPGSLRRLDTPAIETSHAALLPDRNYMIAAGTLIDCDLDTPVNTMVAGPLRCHLLADVYSDNKQVVLMEAGTEFFGEQTDSVMQGQDRAFGVLRRAKTPKGVIINVGSPATDSLGTPGIPGWVDSQFGKRFGAALGIALMQDATALAVASRSSGAGQNTFVLGNTAQAGSALAEKAFDASANISPVLRTNQGPHIQVMLARDLDFRDVYELKRSEP
jgi:type IV secretion system protein VirB10